MGNSRIRTIYSGYLEFDRGAFSDHRCLWIDITYQGAYGYRLSPLGQKQIRKLNSYNPQLVERYNSQVKSELKAAGTLHSLEALQTQAMNQGWNERLEEDYNQLHCRIQNVRMETEKKLQKIRVGKVKGHRNFKNFGIP